MSEQSKKVRRKSEPGACRCPGCGRDPTLTQPQLRQRNALGFSSPENLCLDVLRRVCVAITTENASIHAAAHADAEAKLGREIGGGLVRRVTLLVAALARERPGEFLVMPAGSDLVTPDELAVFSAIRAARFKNRDVLLRRIGELARTQDAGGVFHEIVALAIAISAIERWGGHAKDRGPGLPKCDDEQSNLPAPEPRVLH